jgi:hypothetical protein
MRVSMSAIGSLKLIGSPTRLSNAGDLSPQRQLAEADPAQAELAHVCPRATAPVAAVHPSRAELRVPVRFLDQRFSCHASNLPAAATC